MKQFEANKQRQGSKASPLLDTTKANILDSIAQIYWLVKPDSAYFLAQQELSLSQQIGYKKGISTAYNVIAVVNDLKKNFPIADEYFRKSLEISEEIGYKTGTAWTYNNIAIFNVEKGDYKEAEKDFLIAKQLFDEIGDEKKVANIYLCLGDVYRQYDINYEEAKKYCLKALDLFKKQGDHHNVGLAYFSLGFCYGNQGNYPQSLDLDLLALKEYKEINEGYGILTSTENIGVLYDAMHYYPEAIKYYKDALQIATSIKDNSMVYITYCNLGGAYFHNSDFAEALTSEQFALQLSSQNQDSSWMSWSCGFIGDVYFAQGNYAEALKYYKRAYDVVSGVRFMNEIASASIHLGATYEKLGNVNEALRYETKGLSLATKTGSKEHLKEAYQNLALIYARQGNYRSAYESEVSFKKLYDSVYNKESENKFTSLQMQYGFDRKQDSIKAETVRKEAISRKEINNQKNIRNFLSGGLLLMLGFAGFVFRSLRISRKQKIAIEIQKNRAEQSERFKQQFLANMSHEIRTPMNAVSGMTDVLLEKGPRPDQVEYLTAISKSSDILLHIINDILDLSKIEAGKLELESIDFSLTDAIKQVGDTLSYKAEEKGLQLITHIDDSIDDVVVGDPYRLNQVLINLGGNAIKFTAKGSVEIVVNKVSEADGKLSLRFSVTDTGMGIPAHKLQTLFESFTQANSSDTRKFGGTGLGLSISKQLVELQGGNIVVESREGSGSTFSFTITYLAGSPEKLQQRIAQEQRIDGNILNGLRLLVADDNEYNRLVVNETLRLKAKMQIDLVTNGQEAVQMLRQNDYDVILMDVQMPVMNGIEATKYIRSQMPAPKSKTPVIALTASILRADLDMCTESGMNSYVPKPFKAWQLIHTIADVTGRQHLNDQARSALNSTAAASDSETTGDLSYLREFCEGDENRMKKYVGLYLKAIPAFREKLLAGVSAKDMDEIALHVHSFKPKWMMMGMKYAGELAVKIDQQCRVGSDNVFENVALLIRETERSAMELGGILDGWR